MAKKPVSKKKTSTKSSDANDNVVRIKAGASAPKKAKETKKTAVVTTESAKQTSLTDKAAKEPNVKKERKKRSIFGAIGGYFKGAWSELRQVHWPTRRATWSLTGAVLVYSAFFVVLVLLLDAGFKYLFELLLGK